MFEHKPPRERACLKGKEKQMTFWASEQQSMCPQNTTSPWPQHALWRYRHLRYVRNRGGGKSSSINRKLTKTVACAIPR